MPKLKERIPFIEEFEREKLEQRWKERQAAEKTSRRSVLKEKRLFWFLMLRFDLKDDRALAEFIGTSPAQISTIRNDKIGLSPRLVLSIYDKTNLSIEDIRAMANEDMKEE